MWTEHVSCSFAQFACQFSSCVYAFFGFSVHLIILSVNKDSLIFAPLQLLCLFIFLALLRLASTSSIMLNGNGDRGP